MSPPRRGRHHPRADHHHLIRPPNQGVHRQQHVSAPAARAPRPPRTLPNQQTDPATQPARSGMPPRPEPPPRRGHTNNPAANRRSTCDTSLPTVTTAPPRASGGAPGGPRKRRPGGPTSNRTPHIVTLSSHTNDTTHHGPVPATAHDQRREPDSPWSSGTAAYTPAAQGPRSSRWTAEFSDAPHSLSSEHGTGGLHPPVR